MNRGCSASISRLVFQRRLFRTRSGGTSCAVAHGLGQQDQKLVLLYRYLSGIEFRERVEAIVESFERIREDLPGPLP